MSPTPPSGGDQPAGWAPGTATGVGSLPGEDPLQALDTVLGELPLPHLPELPARGPGAQLVGRTAAVLLDLPVDLDGTRWRFVGRPGADLARARGLLERDLDVLADRAGGHTGLFKVQLAGPWTLAAALERTRGGAILVDPVAVADLAASLAEGLAVHLRDVAARLPRARLVAQLDEPGLPAVLAGEVPSTSGATRLPVPAPTVATERLATVLAAAAGAGALPGVHCCAAPVPVGLLAAAGARWVGLDAGLLRPDDDAALGEALEAGVLLVAGVLPALGERPAPVSACLPPVLELWRRLGLAPAGLATSVALSPTCGLAGAAPGYARAVLRRARQAAEALAEAAG